MKDCYIMVGPPGSGKSTKTWEILEQQNILLPECFNNHVCSADNYMKVDGKYQFNWDRLREAHMLCMKRFIQLINNNEECIVVDNCNVSKEHISPYITVASAFDYKVHVIRFPFTQAKELEQRNIHGVPLTNIQKMQRSMEHMFNSWPHYWPQPESPYEEENVIDLFQEI